jgi:hypothetical protein
MTKIHAAASFCPEESASSRPERAGKTEEGRLRRSSNGAARPGESCGGARRQAARSGIWRLAISITISPAKERAAGRRAGAAAALAVRRARHGRDQGPGAVPWRAAHRLPQPAARTLVRRMMIAATVAGRGLRLAISPDDGLLGSCHDGRGSASEDSAPLSHTARPWRRRTAPCLEPTGSASLRRIS